MIMSLILLCPAAALAVPMTLSHQGRLLDSSGAPLDGSHDLEFQIFDAASSGSEIWGEVQTLNLTNGYYSAQLGSVDAMVEADFANDDLWLAISVGSDPELSRVKLNSVPYAVRATSLAGGSIDAGDISVNGVPIVDSSGSVVANINYSNITGAPADSDTLASLSCGANSVAMYDGSAWDCSATVPLSMLPMGTGATDVAYGNASYPKADTYTKTEIDTAISISGVDEYSFGPLITNSRFESGDFSGWTQDIGSGGVGAVSDGQAGGFVYANDPFAVAWISSDERITIRPGQDYNVSGSFRRTESVGNDGTFYLAVRLFDSTGANIGGDGTWWYYPIGGQVLDDQAWHRYSIDFGPNFGRDFPAGAVTMSVGAILNYDGGNRNYETTNLQLTIADPPSTFPQEVWRARAGSGSWSGGSWQDHHGNLSGAMRTGGEAFTYMVSLDGHYVDTSGKNMNFRVECVNQATGSTYYLPDSAGHSHYLYIDNNRLEESTFFGVKKLPAGTYDTQLQLQIESGSGTYSWSSGYGNPTMVIR